MDKIYFNGDILTMEEDRQEPEAVLVSGTVITLVGSLKEAERLSPGAEMNDLKGKTLMPAFID